MGLHELISEILDCVRQVLKEGVSLSDFFMAMLIHVGRVPDFPLMILHKFFRKAFGLNPLIEKRCGVD
jgi:hypothetical protein